MVVGTDVDHNGELITTFGIGDAVGEFETPETLIGDITGMTAIAIVTATVIETATAIETVIVTAIVTAIVIETFPKTTIGDTAMETLIEM